MYNNAAASITYQDARWISRKSFSVSKPSFHPPQNPLPEFSASRAFPKFDAPKPKRIIDPQATFTRSISTGPSGLGRTIISMGRNKGVTHESPIVKVTTRKQVFYPSFQDETEEVLEMQDKYGLPSKTVYSKPMYSEEKYYNSPSYRNKYDNRDRERDRDYDYHDRRSGSKEDQGRRSNRDKRHSRHSKTSYKRNDPIYVEAVPTYPTQTIVPMYTQIPMYNSSMYYPVSSPYTYYPYTDYTGYNGE